MLQTRRDLVCEYGLDDVIEGRCVLLKKDCLKIPATVWWVFLDLQDLQVCLNHRVPQRSVTRLGLGEGVVTMF